MKKYCDCYSLEERICYICDNEYMHFLSKPNVIGIGLGYKIKGGFNTFKKCITVFVNKKILSKYLNTHQLIPTNYRGIKTDVIESGNSYLKSLKNRVRPVKGGYNVGVLDKDKSGTMACLVKDKKGNLYVLSNNHVLAGNNLFPLGINIVQPAQRYHEELNIDIIGTLSKYIPLKPKNILYYPTNYVDCAIAKVTDSSLVSSEIALIGKIKGIKNDVVLNEPIKKVGSITELTTGIVTNINVTMYVYHPRGICLFKKQIWCNCVSLEGDSGALALDDNDYAIGMVMSGGDDTVTINPIKYVLDSLKVNIVE